MAKSLNNYKNPTKWFEFMWISGQVFFLFKIIHLISHKHTFIGKSFFPLFVLNNTLLNIKDEQKNSVSFMQIKVGIVMVNL